MDNNIKNILDAKGISIYRLSIDTGITYSTVYELVHRKELEDTKIGTLKKVASTLQVDITELYGKGGSDEEV